MKGSIVLLGALTVLTACVNVAPSDAELDRRVTEIIKGSFREQGLAGLERLNQDPAQAACSAADPPSAAVAAMIEAQALASVQPPADGRYLGDWREGERIAQSGAGQTWTDRPTAPNGGSCYNCHQITRAEISFGTIGPSLAQYGKLRGVSDPAAPESAAIVQYTWGKLYNSKASNACSNMPRFGHMGILTQQQLQHLMALLLDPKSPVNE
jgi:sulfur-oxidizing protein SoxX